MTAFIDRGSHFDVRVRRDDVATVIEVAGEVDASNCTELHQQISVVLNQSDRGPITLDLSELTFLDSAGIRALLQCRAAAERQDRRLEIRRAHDNVRQVLAICQLTDLFRLPAAEVADEDPHRIWRPWW